MSMSLSTGRFHDPQQYALTYVTHSGFGHQMQALLRGVFVSQVTHRTLLVPPLMSHKGSLEVTGSKGCSGRKQIMEYMTKQKMLERSLRALHRNCLSEGDSFFQLYNFSRFQAADYGCGTVTTRRRLPRSTCNGTVHDTLTQWGWLPKGRGPSCDVPLECDQMIHKLTNGRASASSGVSSILGSVKTLCLGPLNEFVVRGVLANCSAYGLARELKRNGLPLSTHFLQKLDRHLPPARNCTCVYLRLPDESFKNFTAMKLWVTGWFARMNRTQNSAWRQALSPHGTLLSPLEVVSNCNPIEKCEQHFSELFGTGRVLLNPHRRQAASFFHMTPRNAEMVYDMARCARCPQPILTSRPDSSFVHAIDMMHTRLHEVEPMSRLRDI